MRIIEQLVYKIQGDNSEFDKSIDKSETKVSKFGKVADKMLAGVTVAAIGMVIKKAGDMVVAVAGATDRVDKMSQKIGISRQAFQEWDFILSQSGTSVDGLQMAVKTLSGAADEAMKGTKQYADTFDRLGVSVTDVNGNMKDQETLFNEVFSALANLDNQTERTALANDLLGRSATELAPAFNAGGDAIEAMRTQAHELGLVMDDELIDNGVILTDNIDKLKRAYQGWKNEALEPLLGLAVTFTDKLLGQASASDKLITQANTLVKINKDYKNALKSVEDGYIGVTQASLGLLAAQKEALLFDLEKIYFDSKKELDSLNKTIETNKDINARNNAVLDAMAKKYNTTRDGLARLAAQERISTDDRDKYNDTVDAINVSYGKYIEAVNKANSAEVNRKQFVDNMAEAYAKGQIEIERFIDIDMELYNQIKAGAIEYEKNQKAIESRNKAIELAQEAFKAYGDASQETLERLINLNSANKDSAYNTELVRLATEKLNEMLAEKARLAETEAEKEKARAEIIANTNKAISDAEKVSIALGDAYDLTSSKAGIFTSAIEALIESGLEPYDDRIKTFITSLQKLGTTTKGVTFERLSLLATEEEAFLFSLEKQSEAYLEQGYEQAEIDEWKEKKKKEFYANIEKLQEAQTKKAIEEAEKVKQAWEDATFSMLGSVTSIWGSINQVQANANEEEIQRIKEQNAIAIQAAKDRGATEEEITELEKSLQADLNDAKNKYAKEEAERNKALSTLSVILDTAKAIMQIWANPLIAPWGKGLWTGLAASAGAAQIAAINSAPVPSYDVGSIRIPETTTATVHKDEMILTAPQAEQARREGITIAPTNRTSGTVPFVVQLDGREIARAMLDNINTGSVGTIKARVVK